MTDDELDAVLERLRPFLDSDTEGMLERHRAGGWNLTFFRKCDMQEPKGPCTALLLLWPLDYGVPSNPRISILEQLPADHWPDPLEWQLERV